MEIQVQEKSESENQIAQDFEEKPLEKETYKFEYIPKESIFQLKDFKENFMKW